MTVTLALKIRECDKCGHRSVPLEGIGSPCIRCPGEYTARSGSKVVEIEKETAEQLREENPEVIAE